MKKLLFIVMFIITLVNSYAQELDTLTERFYNLPYEVSLKSCTDVTLKRYKDFIEGYIVVEMQIDTSYKLINMNIVKINLLDQNHNIILHFNKMENKEENSNNLIMNFERIINENIIVTPLRNVKEYTFPPNILKLFRFK